VEQDSPALTLYRRSEGWQPRRLSGGDTLRLESVGFDLPLAAIFEGLDLAPDRG
jgi:hypothetical protein